MRLAGHLSVIGRDRAGYTLSKASTVPQPTPIVNGHDPGCATSTDYGCIRRNRRVLRQAAHRDTALLSWLASDTSAVPPLDLQAGLDGIRQATFALEREKEQLGPSESIAQKAQAIQEQLSPHLIERPDLAIDSFED